MADEALELRKRKLALQTQFGQLPAAAEPETVAGRGGIRPASTGAVGGISTGKRFEDAIRSLAEGMTLGFSDEIEAAARAALSSELTFDEALGQVRERMAEIDPNARLVGNIAGGFGLGPIAGGVSRAAGIGSNLLRAPSTVGGAALQGGALGGVAGAGFAEGGLQERALGAAGGAVLGAPLGAAGQAAVQGVTGAINRGRMGLNRPQARAVHRVAEELSDAGTTPQRVAAQQARLGPEAVLADVPELQRLGQQTASRTAAGQRIAQQALEGRASRAGMRVENALDTALGGTDLRAIRQGIVRARQRDALPLYEQALSGGPLQRTPRLEALIGTGERGSGSTMITGAIRNIRGSNPRFRNRPDTDPELLHAVRVQLGERSRGQGAAKRNINEIVQELTDAMDDAGATGYRQAVDQFRSDSLTLEAFDEGRKALNALPEDIQSFLQTRPEGERAAYVAGLGREALRRVTSGETGNAAQAVRGLLRGERAQVLREALGPEAYEAFRERLLRELQFAQTSGRILGGSPTQPRQAGSEEQFRRLGRVARAVGGLRQGAGVPGALAELATATERAGPRLNQERALAQLLFATNRQGIDPSRFQRISPLGALAARQRLVQRTAPFRAGVPGAAGVGAGQLSSAGLGALGFNGSP